MKKIVLLILGCILPLISCGQGISIVSNYAFHNCTVLDRNFNVIQELPSQSGNPIGLYILAKENGKEYIAITIGDESAYEIKVVNVVRGDVENNTRIDMYQGGMIVEGQIAVINVFLEYNLKRNNSIPEAITIDVNNSPNFIRFSGLIPVHK